MAILEVRNLSKVYRLGNVAVNALADVSFSVSEGSITCITGRSGSGKSTLLRQLGLLDRPTRGQIVLNGREVTTLPDGARSRIRLTYLGYVFQEFALLQELTAHENICLPGIMLGTDRQCGERGVELLDLVGLKARRRHRPSELSGGEQQRVAIARALINRPHVLFADEPCANLDTTSSQMVMETLVRLNADMKTTVVFVSHDPDDRRYATNSLRLSDGRLVSDGGDGGRR